jgi:hypothetical protein
VGLGSGTIQRGDFSNTQRTWSREFISRPCTGKAESMDHVLLETSAGLRGSPLSHRLPSPALALLDPAAGRHGSPRSRHWRTQSTGHQENRLGKIHGTSGPILALLAVSGVTDVSTGRAPSAVVAGAPWMRRGRHGTPLGKGNGPAPFAEGWREMCGWRM